MNFQGGSVEYETWSAMKRRCLTPSSGSYRNYGAKGVTVCLEWVQSFEAFLQDMGPRPFGGTLDRIDGTKGYSPENCRWATVSEQNRNRKDNCYITIDGVTKIATDWARELNISLPAFRRRIKNWPQSRWLEPRRKVKNG